MKGTEKIKTEKECVGSLLKTIPRFGDLTGLTECRSHYTHNYGLLPQKDTKQN